MVQKEIGPIEKAPEGKGATPEGSQESGEKKGSPEEKKESPEGNGKKKFKAEAFPLGTPEGEKQTPEGEAKKGDIPSGDEAGSPGHKSAPSGERGENKDPSHPLKEKKKIPSEDKEEIMDDETKKFIADTVEGLEKKIGARVDEIGQTAKGAQDGVEKISQAIEAIKTEATPKTPAEIQTKEPAPSAEEVARKAVEMIKEEDERERKLQGEEEARTREHEEQVEFRKWCLDNPQAKECKDLPELIGKIMDKKLEKKPAQGPGTKETEAKLPKKKWDDMTPEERRTLVEEIDRRGEPHSAYYELMRLCSISGKDDACNILGKALKDFTVEEVLQELPEEKSQELSKVVCIGDACKPLRVWLKDKEGIALLKKTDKGWKPVDEEVEKEMDTGPHV